MATLTEALAAVKLARANRRNAEDNLANAQVVATETTSIEESAVEAAMIALAERMGYSTVINPRTTGERLFYIGLGINDYDD